MKLTRNSFSGTLQNWSSNTVIIIVLLWDHCTTLSWIKYDRRETFLPRTICREEQETGDKIYGETETIKQWFDVPQFNPSMPRSDGDILRSWLEDSEAYCNWSKCNDMCHMCNVWTNEKTREATDQFRRTFGKMSHGRFHTSLYKSASLDSS